MIYMYRRPKTFEESFFALSVARSFMFANGVREPFVFACVCVRLQSLALPPPRADPFANVHERSRTFANTLLIQVMAPAMPALATPRPPSFYSCSASACIAVSRLAGPMPLHCPSRGYRPCGAVVPFIHPPPCPCHPPARLAPHPRHSSRTAKCLQRPIDGLSMRLLPGCLGLHSLRSLGSDHFWMVRILRHTRARSGRVHFKRSVRTFWSRT